MKQYLSNMVQILAGGFRWWLNPDEQAQLLGPDGLRLNEWVEAGQAQIIKKSHNRTIYRVELPRLSFYLKHNRMPDLWAWFRQVVRPSKARTEFDRAVAVARRGLPTITPLALGEKPSLLGGESYLLTHSLDGTQSLLIFLQSLGVLPAADQARYRLKLARALGEFIGRIHRAGILHRDLHGGNILLRHERGERLSLFLIDLNAVRLGSPLNWRRSLENLCMFNRWFQSRSTRADRFRFWQAYLAMRRGDGALQADDPGSVKRLARDIETHTLDSLSVLCAHFERRCLKTNRQFTRVWGRAGRGHVVTELDQADWQRLLADPDEPFRRRGAKMYKDSNASTVTEMDVRIQGQVRRVIYKRLNVNSWTNPLADLVRPSPAMRSWVDGQAVLQRSLNTPRPLMLMHRRRFGLDWEGYLMTEKIEDAQELGDFLTSLDLLDSGARQSMLRQCVSEVAKVMRNLHRWNFSNRDPKAANWLIGPNTRGPDGQLKPGGVWIIDLVGIAHKKRLSHWKRIKNLGRLNASFHESRLLTRTDRLRFLRTYMQWSLAGKEGWKTWWRAIIQATEAKVRRNLRSHRILT